MHYTMIKKLLPLSLALALAACGGGGSGGDDNNNNDDGNDPSPSSVGADKYVGTWVLNCAPSSLTRAGATLHRKVSYTFTKVNDTQVSYTTFADIYEATNCTGTALTRLSANPGTVQIDDTTTLNGASVDQVTMSRGAWLSPVGGTISAGGTITLGGITYPGNFFLKPAPTKDLAQVTSTTLTFGSLSSPLDAKGYPTALGSNVYQKQ
jgi:hypothetical protein